jgi:MoxR-like ATPase
MRRYEPEAPSAVQAKFLKARRELSDALIERDEEVDLVLTALVAQEHPLLIGPPGTAKSLLLDALMQWTSGRRFTALLTRFSAPEELFGPVSVQGLKEDKYRRVTTGKLPEAHLAYLDEVFKASSAILNTLLRILNERVFENGDGALVRVPLLLCVASSNEWPHAQEGGKELAAVFDRFTFRRAVRPILSQAGRQRLLWTRDHTPMLSTTITPEEIQQARAEALALPWGEDAKQTLEAILKELAREGIQPGDRRQFKSVAVAQAFAYLSGADQVEPEHLEVLASVLWDDPVGVIRSLETAA